LKILTLGRALLSLKNSELIRGSLRRLMLADELLRCLC
jgi:hypothetical protein